MKRTFSCSEVVIVGKTVDNVSVDPSSDFLAPLWYEEDHNQLCLPRTISQTTTVKPIQIPFNLPKKRRRICLGQKRKIDHFWKHI